MAGRGFAGLTPGMKAFLAVDAVLVVLLVLLFVVVQRGGDDGDAGAAATPTPSGTAAPAPEATPAEAVAFALPSGNIACDMSAGGVECRIASFTYAAPEVAGCEGATGNVVRLDAQGFAFVCVEGDPPATAGADVPVLEYGSQETAGEYTCRSGTDGVTCSGAGGVGFRLARADWTELP
ncbi:hypothetical protein [Cellulomonas shaoxiangyii]|uniref:Uncharacterized protein n=1 Tax=Cellulomonas shaoxiangyii TaxID=2566013 RepID=A0A4P7SJ11_9CELL|nr:hypothetical protein [Cellulomonas shaoxiangyii]QCB94060.1 hypothetical protein E5225_11275 [Cellulomonas shaoxiangyii]TGY85751.1 hypothetical protein E5226_04910 [Cellulomonas shaoxiangyii]